MARVQGSVITMADLANTLSDNRVYIRDGKGRGTNPP
jgi:hypothetical protein